MAGHDQQIEACRSIFLELKIFWKLSLVGFITLLGMGAGVYAWSWQTAADMEAKQDRRIEQVEHGLNAINDIKALQREVLINQAALKDKIDVIMKRGR